MIADAICILETSKRKELFAIEVYNGTDTNRVHQSLVQHLLALKDGQPSRQFQLDHGSRILCVFELETCKTQVMKRLFEDERFVSAKEYFLFKTLDEVKENLFDGWWLFDGTATTMF